MPGTLTPYFNFYRFPTGRRLFALTQLCEEARKLNLANIVELTQRALDQDRKTAELEATWQRARNVQQGSRVKAQAIDAELDRALGGLAGQLSALAHSFGTRPRGVKASELSAALFPEGAAALTTLSYENELAAVDVLLGRLRGPLATAIDELGLGAHVELITTLAADFRAALATEATREVSFSDVREAGARGHEALLEVVAVILGTFHGSSDEHVSTRNRLLAPVMNQQRRIADTYTARKGSVSDVDASTGEETGTSLGDN
jgi:hypothetical protein